MHCGKYFSDFHIEIQYLFDIYCDISINQYTVTALVHDNMQVKFGLGKVQLRARRDSKFIVFIWL